MAVGTVSGLNLDDAWQLIATNTMTAAASTTFSSLSGYKTYMVVNKNITQSTGNFAKITFNGDTTAGNYGSIALWDFSTNAQYSNNSIIAWGFGAAKIDNYTVYTIIQNADKTVPKITKSAGYLTFLAEGIWTGTSPITSITFSASTGTFTGDILLYGIPA